MQKLGIRTIFYLLVLGAMLTNTGYAKHTDIKKVQVRFVARSTAIRCSWCTSDDTYLVQIQSETNELPFYAKLVDTYVPSDFPLPWRILTSEIPVSMGVVRDAQCDIRYEDMPIRSAPGDSATLIPRKIIYHSPETDAIQAEQIIPCYRTAGKRRF
jgi:hypothetical protein